MGAKKALADVYIGKFSYTQPAQPANPYQRPQGTMSTFVRLNGEKEVYAVDGYLSMTFNRSITDYRDSKVLQVQKDKIQQISVTNPGGNYTLTHNNDLWMIDGLQTDSASVAKFISGLTYLRSTNYKNDDAQPVFSPNFNMQIQGENGVLLANIDGYYTDSTNITITSSSNPGTYFDGTKTALFNKLFKNKSEFLKQ